jgi:translation initiation factor 1A
MPNTKGGKNYKKGKKGKGKTSGKKTETPYADTPGLLYAQVKTKLGGDRISVECSDGVDRQAIIPGSFYKRVWVNKNDILLIQINELNTKESFILYKYSPAESHSLKSQGLLKFDLGDIQEDDNIQFGDDDGEESEDEDQVQAEVDKKMQEQKKTPVEVPKEVKESADEKSHSEEELTPLAKKNKLKTDNLKRQNDRKGKYLKDDGDIDIDAI